MIGGIFPADSRWLASAPPRTNGAIRVWECSAWTEVMSVKVPSDTSAMFLAFSLSGKWIATSEYRRGARLCDFDSASLTVNHPVSHDGSEMVSHVAFAPLGDTFLTSGWE
jgi:hypothetical protein